jgi:hypothetical protein
MTIREINELGFQNGFTVTSNFDFVLIKDNKGKIVTQEQLNLSFNSINDVWDYICNNGIKNIHGILTAIK